MSGLLGSGGGTQDRMIWTSNTANGQLMNQLDTGGQVGLRVARQLLRLGSNTLVIASIAFLMPYRTIEGTM